MGNCESVKKQPKTQNNTTILPIKNIENTENNVKKENLTNTNLNTHLNTNLNSNTNLNTNSNTNMNMNKSIDHINIDKNENKDNITASGSALNTIKQKVETDNKPNKEIKSPNMNEKKQNIPIPITGIVYNSVNNTPNYKNKEEVNPLSIEVELDRDNGGKVEDINDMNNEKITKTNKVINDELVNKSNNDNNIKSMNNSNINISNNNIDSSIQQPKQQTNPISRINSKNTNTVQDNNTNISSTNITNTNTNNQLIQENKKKKNIKLAEDKIMENIEKYGQEIDQIILNAKNTTNTTNTVNNKDSKENKVKGYYDHAKSQIESNSKSNTVMSTLENSDKAKISNRNITDSLKKNIQVKGKVGRFECPTCYETYSLKNFPVLLSCAHSVCLKCFGDIRINLKQSKCGCQNTKYNIIKNQVLMDELVEYLNNPSNSADKKNSNKNIIANKNKVEIFIKIISRYNPDEIKRVFVSKEESLDALLKTLIDNKIIFPYEYETKFCDSEGTEIRKEILPSLTINEIATNNTITIK